MDVDTTVGVPVMAPFELSERPTGSEGETVQETTVPPPCDGAFVLGLVIATPLVRTNELGLYTIFDGGASLTTKVRVAELLPPELVAVTV